MPKEFSTKAWPYAVDLFSGAGLLGFAFQVEGFNVAEYCEWNRAAVETLNYNYGLDLSQCDAQAWTPKRKKKGTIDLMFGGPPCQPYSAAGKGKGACDQRDMFPLTLKWAEDHRPRYMVWENSGTQGPQHAEWRKDYWAAVRKLGYEGVVWDLWAADYGTPQYRRRAFFVLWRKGDARAAERLSEPPPATHARPDLAEDLGLLPWVSGHSRLMGGCCGRYSRYSCAALNNTDDHCADCIDGDRYVQARNEEWGDPPEVWVTENERGQMEFYPSEPLRYLAAPEWRGPLRPDQIRGILKRRDRILKHLPADMSGGFGPLPKRRMLSQGMVASMQKGWPYGLVISPEAGPTKPSDLRGLLQAQLREGTPGLRFLSVREAAKLQDCPQGYVFRGSVAQQYKQVGNAVPVNLGRAVARHVMYGMGRRRSKNAMADDPHSGLWPAFGDAHPCWSAYRNIMRLQGHEPAQMELTIPVERLTHKVR